MNIQHYIQSGIIEEYVMGLSSPADKQEFENLLPLYPELRLALYHYEVVVEEKALADAVPPPSGLKRKIDDVINRLPAKRPLFDEAPPIPPFTGNKESYIPLKEIPDSQIKVHKNWRLIVLIVFLFAKICLGFLVYFAIQYHDARNEIRQLKDEIRHITAQQR